MIKFSIVNSDQKFQSDYLCKLIEYINSEYKIIENSEEDFRIIKKQIKLLHEDRVYKINMKLGDFKNYEKLDFEILEVVELDTYNKYLESLKINIKNKIMELWEGSHCIWLEDSQSELLSQKLYEKINKVENLLRNFINICMIEYLGVYWWGKISPEKFATDFHNKKSEKYKSKFVNFSNVEDSLMTINADDLSYIMKLEIKKWDAKHTQELEKYIRLGDKEKFFKEMEKQLVVEKKLWEEIFSKYFEKSFLGRWGNFCEDRNHIAHNKLIDLDNFSRIDKNVKELQEQIINANSKFSATIISEEEKELIEEELIEEEEFMKSIMEEEAGVTIRNEYEIENLFKETINYFLDEIYEEYAYYEDIKTEIKKLEFETNQIKKLLTIKNELKESEKLELEISDYGIIDSQGATSHVSLNALFEGEVKFTCTLTYTNGEVEFYQEGSYYIPVTEDELGDREFEEFKENVINFIKEKFPDKYERIEEYHKKNMFFVDSYCKECGEESVLNEDDILPKGTCLNCNHENVIELCDRCGEEYIKNDEEDLDLCPICKENFECQIEKD